MNTFPPQLSFSFGFYTAGSQNGIWVFLKKTQQPMLIVIPPIYSYLANIFLSFCNTNHKYIGKIGTYYY